MKISKPILIFIIIIIFSAVSFLTGIQFEKLTNKANPPQTETTQTPPPPQEGTIVRVVDGDTLELDSGKTVRLIGTNTPETGQPFHDEAATFTSNLVLGKQVRLEYEKGYEQDKFGRLLAHVFVNDKNLSVELVKTGLAKVSIYEKRRKLIYQDQLMEAQNEAQEKKLGVWK